MCHYTALAGALLNRYGIAQAGWIGTSMGGLIGMRMASGALAGRLSWLIINDIGPEVPQGAIDRIVVYAGPSPEFATVVAAGATLRQQIYAPFGPAPEAYWTRMARTSVRRRSSGA